MPNPSEKSKIPLLEPALFKEELIEENWTATLKSRVNDFFIHSFKDDKVPLKLPLPLHKKTVNDFVLITDGKMTKTIGLESFSLTANQFLFTPKNSITTTLEVSEDLAGFYCHFSDDFIANNPFLKTWNTQLVLQNLLHLKPKETKILLPLLQRLTDLYRDSAIQPQNERLIPYYLSVFVVEVSLILEGKASIKDTHPLVNHFQKLVNENFKTVKNVQFYAEELHVSPNHLNKIVKKETGKTALQIIHHICILEAKVLLVQTYLDISEIAYHLGFEDTSYFSRFFKKHTGTTPSFYRKMIGLS